MLHEPNTKEIIEGLQKVTWSHPIEEPTEEKWRCGKCDGADVPEHFRTCPKRFPPKDTCEEEWEEAFEKIVECDFSFYNNNNPIEDDEWSLKDENREYLYKVVENTRKELGERIKSGDIKSFIRSLVAQKEAAARCAEIALAREEGRKQMLRKIENILKDIIDDSNYSRATQYEIGLVIDRLLALKTN